MDHLGWNIFEGCAKRLRAKSQEAKLPKGKTSMREIVRGKTTCYFATQP